MKNSFNKIEVKCTSNNTILHASNFEKKNINKENTYIHKPKNIVQNNKPRGSRARFVFGFVVCLMSCCDLILVVPGFGVVWAVLDLLFVPLGFFICVFVSACVLLFTIPDPVILHGDTREFQRFERKHKHAHVHAHI